MAIAAILTHIPALKNSRPLTIFNENNKAFGAQEIGNDTATDDETAVRNATRAGWVLWTPSAIGKIKLEVAVSFITVDNPVDNAINVAITISDPDWKIA